MPSKEWTVNVPISDLYALQQLPETIKLLQADIIQLRRELEALRGIQSQTLQLFADIKRERKTG